jgi:hypothetical protein
MALVNCESSNGYLEATANGGYGISEVESANGKTIVNVRNVLTTWEATTNINQSTENGILDSIIPLKRGDKVAVIDDNGEAQIVVLGEPIVKNIAICDVECDPRATAIHSEWWTCPGKAFDEDNSTFWSSNGGRLAPWWIQWDFEEEATILQYRLASDSTQPIDWILQGSLNGSDWVDIDAQEGQSLDSNLTTYDLDVPATFRYFRLWITKGKYYASVKVNTFELIGQTTSFDVSDVQSGAVTAYSLSDRVYFRGENTDDTFYTSSSVSIDENSLNYDSTVPKLQYQSLQKRVAVPECTEIVSKYELSAINQKMIESSFDIYVDEE